MMEIKTIAIGGFWGDFLGFEKRLKAVGIESYWTIGTDCQLLVTSDHCPKWKLAYAKKHGITVVSDTDFINTVLPYYERLKGIQHGN